MTNEHTGTQILRRVITVITTVALVLDCVPANAVSEAIAATLPDPDAEAQSLAIETPPDDDAGTDEDTKSDEPKPEQVTFHFVANAKNAEVSGEMQDFAYVMNGQPHRLPQVGWAREGWSFNGWSTTRDGHDVADDPLTTDKDESLAAVSVPDALESTDLGWDEEIIETHTEEDGAITETRRSVPRNLDFAKKDGIITLYAQWTRNEKAEPKATEMASRGEGDVAPPEEPVTEQMAPDTDTTENTPTTPDELPDASTKPNITSTNTKETSDTPNKTSTKQDNVPTKPEDMPADTNATSDKPDDASDQAAAKPNNTNVSVTSKNDLAAVITDGEANDETTLSREISETAELDVTRSLPIAKTLLRTEEETDAIPRQADGSVVEALALRWITPDTEDDGIDEHLYLRPSEDSSFGVRMRLTYALSGEHDYDPGTVMITIPDTMFRSRDGRPTGTIEIPYPEEPKATNDFMWSRQDGSYVLTNARKLRAATKGYIEIGINDLVPHTIVDQSLTSPFQASIEVVTHKGNVIGLTSTQLNATVDTEAKVVSATKYGNASEIEMVGTSEVPQECLVDNESEYVRVRWHILADIQGNTPATLSYVDEKQDAYTGSTPSNGSASTSVSKTCYTDLYKRQGSQGEDTITFYYPMSQFEPDVTYTFENRVTYTLEETDPTVDDDPKLLTTAQADASLAWSWKLPEFSDPTGHFMVNKIGNDGPDGNAPAPYYAHPYRASSGTNLDTNIHNRDDYYGNYPSAINDLAKGHDVQIGYTVESIGYLLPWTYEGDDPRVVSNYGRRPVTMTTTDTDGAARLETDLLGDLQVGTDYEYVALELPKRPEIFYANAINLNEDGSFVAVHAGDGTVDYATDSDDSHVPDVVVEAEVSGSWHKIATASWKTGELALTPEQGVTVDGCRINLPQGTTRTRTSVTTNIAAIYYYARPIMVVHASARLSAAARAALEASALPSLEVNNSCVMVANDADGRQIVELHKTAADRLAGYSTDIAVEPHKAATYARTDIDYTNKNMRLHYGLQVDERSLIPLANVYQQAVRDGGIVPETHGVYRDLLPRGVKPDVLSVRLRQNDRILSVNAIEDWRGSGRTMLVVEASLSPTLITYSNQDVSNRYMDRLQLSFDATYSFDDMHEHGDELHNVFSFESLAKPEIGDIENWRGEADTPYTNNNTTTQRAFESDAERDLMVGTDPQADGHRFVYAGTTTHLDVLSAGQTELAKQVDVNDEGVWSQGTYDDERDVLEGGTYSYRMSMTSAAETISKNLVVYDSLENFHAADGNDAADINAPRWRGELVRVDTSALEQLGIAPVVYYSTIDELALADETNPDQGHPQNLILTGEGSVWQRADAYQGPLSAVHAIAVDCTKKSDGSDFELQPLEELAFEVRMHAPYGDAARAYIAQDAHAYNNLYLTCTSVDANTGALDSSDFVRKDYTKVGLKETSLSVEKAFDDAYDQDGIRPDSVRVRLLANGQEVDSVTLSAEPDTSQATHYVSEIRPWAATFSNIPYTDEHGEKISYSFAEDPVDGYDARMTMSDKDSWLMTNVHEPEKISVTGEKTWIGGEDARPLSIWVDLLADGQRINSRHVTPDINGHWHYSFDNLNKYRDHGTEIVYTVKESGVSNVWQTSVDGYNITNTYHPYGDIIFDKVAIGQTEDFLDQQFEFTVNLFKGNEVDPGQYACETSDGRHITVSNGSVVTLAGGQSAHISELPENITVRIEETQIDGYSPEEASQEATIVANHTASLRFRNTYAAEGRVNLKAKKELSGRNLKIYQFRGEVLDENGAILRVASNKADGTMSFGAIRYTQADIGEHTYHIRETQDNAPGYTFDTSEYVAKVTVTDNGDGTLAISTTYLDDQDQPIEIPTFQNAYHAQGTLSMKAWKEVIGRDVADNEFSFELIDSETREVVATGTNDREGTITFSPIAFDENDIGRTVTYVAREVAGDDPTVIYDDTLFGYRVSVSDNGDGTLSFSQSQVDVQGSGNDFVISSEESADTPVFENRLVPSTLRVQKSTEGTVPTGHDNDTFHFRVHLTGEAVEEDFQPQVSIAPAAMSLPLEGAFNWLSGLFTPSVAYAEDAETATYAVLDSNGKLTFFDSPNTYAGNDNVEQTVTDASGRSYTGKVYSGFEDGGTTPNWPNNEISEIAVAEGTHLRPTDCYGWFSETNITSASLTDFDMSACTSTSTMFAGCVQLQSVSLHGTTFGANCYANAMFAGCKKLRNVSFAGCDLSNIGSISNIFSGCTALTSNPFDGFDLSNVSTMESAFESCTSLTSVNMSSTSLPKLWSMQNMFKGCTNLVSVSFANCNFPSLNSLASTFQDCTNLISVDMSGIYAPGWLELNNMCAGCTSLRLFDISESTIGRLYNSVSNTFSGAQVKLDMHNIRFSGTQSTLFGFRGDTGIREADISGMKCNDAIEASDDNYFGYMSYAFNGCTNLTTVKADNAEFGYTVEYMFQGCSSLQSISLTGATLKHTTYMTSMFEGCSSLEELIWNDVDASTINTWSSNFCHGCSSLKRVSMRNWNMGRNQSYYQWFADCVNLESVDISGWHADDSRQGSYMFQNAGQNSGNLVIDAHGWKFGIQNRYSYFLTDMFENCFATSIDFSECDIDCNITDNSSYANRTFYHLPNLTSLNLSNTNIRVNRIDGTFIGDLPKLTTLDLSTFKFENVNSVSSGLIQNCPVLDGTLDLSCICGYPLTQISMAIVQDCPEIDEILLRNLDISRTGASSFKDLFRSWDQNSPKQNTGIHPTHLDFTNARIAPGSDLTDTFVPVSDSIERIDLADMTAISVEKTNGMFSQCSKVQELDISSIDLSNVTSTDGMFSSATSLRSLKLGTNSNLMGSTSTTGTEADLSSSPSGLWINDSVENANPVTAEMLMMNYDGHALDNDLGPGTYVWDTGSYTVSFDPGEGSGSMARIASKPDRDLTIPHTRMFRAGYRQTGWQNADHPEITYDLKGTIPANTYNALDQVTLVATWEASSSADPTTTFDFDLKAGEVATLTNIPAGAAYVIYEDSPEGWVQVSSSGTSGTTVAGQTTSVSFVNAYDEGHTSATIVGQKTLDGSARAVTADTFSFELWENNNLLQTVTAPAGGAFAFAPIRYGESDLGTHTYEVKEVIGNTEHVAYDNHVEQVSVEISMNDRNLSAAITYDETGVLFDNETKPGALEISKEVSGNGGDPKQEFEFEVEFTGDHVDRLAEMYGAARPMTDGTWSPLDLFAPREALAENNTNTVTFDAGANGKFRNGTATNIMTRTVETNDVTLHSHTANISDDGTQNGSYASNLATKDVVTIPGAERLHVNLTYGTENYWDMLYVFQGEYTGTVTRNMNAGQLATYTGGSDTTTTVEFDIEGDTATFAFFSDSVGQYYGYYATITGTAKTPVWTGTYEEPVPNASGSRFYGWKDANDNLVTDWQDMENDTILTAVYSDQTVTYKANGGTGADVIDETSAGYRLQGRIFTNNGQAFTSWNTAADGTGTSYPLRALLPLDAGSLTLYAQWRQVDPREGTAYGIMLDQDTDDYPAGTLVLFRSNETYTDSPQQTVIDIMGNEFNGQIYTNIENQTGLNYNSAPWYARRAQIVDVVIPDREIIAPTNCSGWFYGCKNDTFMATSLSQLDTSNVTSMHSMFDGCSGAAFNPDVSNWNTSSVTNMYGVFDGCSGAAFNPDVSNWDTSKVTDMSYMFKGCSGALFNPNVSNWDTSSVTNMYGMFWDCPGVAFNPDMSNWDTSGVTNMCNMFYKCSGASFNPNVNSWNTSNVTDMNHMFWECSGATFSPDVSNWNTSKVTNMNCMFCKCSGVAFNPDVSNWDTSSVTDMSQMFYYCSGASFNPDVSSWDTSKVTNMNYMFSNCSGTTFNPDVSDWNTSNVTSMSNMFYNCSGSSFNPDVSNWNTSNVTSMGNMFDDCSGATFNPDVSNWNTSKVTNMSYMFHNCSGAAFNPNVSSWDTSKVTDMSWMFYNCYGDSFNPDVSSWDTSKVTSMSLTFYGCYGAAFQPDVSSWDTSKVTNMNSMFSNCYGTSFNPNVSNWNTSSVTNMDSMFAQCYGTAFNPDMSRWNTSSVANMHDMFYNCHGTAFNPDVSNWDTSNVTNMSRMFLQCSNTSFNPDVSNWNTSKVTNMNSMFYGCSGASFNPNMSSWNTSQVTTMEGMFQNCNGISFNPDINNWNTSNITNMSRMFYKCSGNAFTNLDLSNWNTSNVTDMTRMFCECAELTTLDISNFDMSNVTSKVDMMLVGPQLNELSVGPKTNLNNTGLSNHQQTDQYNATWDLQGTAVDETLTSAQLMARVNGAATAESEANPDTRYVGTWVWSARPNVTITFNGNGGIVSGDTSVTQTDNMSPITMPTATRPHHRLASWNDQADGAGTISVEPGGTYTPTAGNDVTLYAQWERLPQNIAYTVIHRKQNTSLDGYTEVDRDVLYTYADDLSQTPPVRTYDHYISPAPQTVVVALDSSTVVTYDYDVETYTISFGDSGLANASVPYNSKFTLPDLPATYIKNSIPLGWTTTPDGTGTIYPAGQEITVTENMAFYPKTIAAFEDSELTGSTYKVRLKVRAGESAVIQNIPAGTTYTIREINTPAGWTEDESASTGKTGTVESEQTSHATVRNTYSGRGHFDVTLYKNLVGRSPVDGEFAFELLDSSGTVVARTTSGEPDDSVTVINQNTGENVLNTHKGMAPITFKDIPVNSLGTSSWRVREVRGNDPTINYSTSVLYFNTITTDRQNGTFDVTTAFDRYSTDTFTNNVKTSSIRLAKRTSNETYASANKQFSFDIELVDEHGKPLSSGFYNDNKHKIAPISDLSSMTPESNEGNVPGTAVVEYDANGGSFGGTYRTNVVGFDGNAETITAVSHTMNLDDEGTKLDDYGSNWTNAHIRGTGRTSASDNAHVILFPGATTLNVTITYGGEGSSYDWACAWAGAHPDYTARSNYGSAITWKLGGGDHTFSSNTKTYQINNDAVTFSYTSDPYECGDGYGYFATVTGNAFTPTGGVYAIPDPPEGFRFDGWYTTPGCISGTELDLNSVVSSHQNVRAYARWTSTDSSYTTYSTPYSNGHLHATLRGDQEILIEGLPYGTQCIVTETDAPGWTATSGNVLSADLGDYAPLIMFTNEYHASGQMLIEGTKEVNGTTTDKRSFDFVLVNESDEFIARGSSDANGYVSIAVPLTQDMAGNTYRYRLLEDTPGDGVVYDASIFQVEASVSDDGEGHLSADVTYLDAAGTPLPDKPGQPGQQQTPHFRNLVPFEMPATGSENRAWVACVLALAIEAVGIIALERRRYRDKTQEPPEH